MLKPSRTALVTAAWSVRIILLFLYLQVLLAQWFVQCAKAADRWAAQQISQARKQPVKPDNVITMSSSREVTHA